MSLVAPQATHKACFHPTAVFGAPAAAAGVAAALGSRAAKNRAGDRHRGKPRLGHHRISRRWKLDQAAARRRSGAIGHPRRAAGRSRVHRTRNRAGRPARFLQCLRAVQVARTLRRCWIGWERTGSRETVAFKPYACGTMTQPFIDCAIELARRGVRADDIDTMVCEVGEGTVHRLWEPLAAEAGAAQRLRGEILHPLLHRGGIHRRQSRI